MHSNNDYCSSCSLCVEINNFKESYFAGICPNFITKNVFFERSRMHVMIPIGPLCEGHLLIVSKKHELSFGHLGKDIIPGLLGLIKDVAHFLKNHYPKNRIIVFEHGALSKKQRGGCCIDHAHMNIMPITDSFLLHDSASKFYNFEPIQFHQLEYFIGQEKPYLFFWCSHEGSFAAEAPDDSSQFFRKLLTSGTSEKNWDWRSNLYVDTVMADLIKDF